MSESSAKHFYNGKVVLITGSSRGIGKVTAKKLCSYGAKVVLNGRNTDALEASVAELKSLSYDVLGINGDVSIPEECNALIEKIIDHFGTIDILINNAGISMRGCIDELDPKVFELVFSSNFYGAVYPTLSALPYLKKSKGSVVFVSSVAGIRGLPGLSAYSSSKMALRAIAETMRFDLKKYGIHIGLVYVGYAENDDGKKYVDKDGSLRTIEKRAGIKTLSKDKIANAILKNILKRRFITIMSGLGRLNAIMQRISPQFVEWVLIRSMKKVESMSK